MITIRNTSIFTVKGGTSIAVRYAIEVVISSPQSTKGDHHHNKISSCQSGQAEFGDHEAVIVL